MLDVDNEIDGINRGLRTAYGDAGHRSALRCDPWQYSAPGMGPDRFKAGQFGAAHQDGNQTAESRGSWISCEPMRWPKPCPPDKLISEFRITSGAYQQIASTIGARHAESGGILLAEPDSYTVTGFVFDACARVTSGSYTPNRSFLQSELRGRGERFAGIVHSHPRGLTMLSDQDRHAAWSNMSVPVNKHLHAFMMPIVQAVPDCGRFMLIPYILTCDPSGSASLLVHWVPLRVLNADEPHESTGRLCTESASIHAADERFARHGGEPARRDLRRESNERGFSL